MNTQHIQLNIPLNFKQIVDLVRQLSPSEKLQLSEILWTEQNIDNIEIPEEQKRVVRERIKKYQNTASGYISWDDIEKKMATRK